MVDVQRSPGSVGLTGISLVGTSDKWQADAPHIPARAGGYALLLRLTGRASIRAGRLGEFVYPAGDYIYLGSARGPGGLRARLARHLRDTKQPHWHIDYLRAYARVYGYLYRDRGDCAGISLELPLECRWSQALASLPGAGIPAARFGASDCRSGCPAHLIAFEPGWFSANPKLLEKILFEAELCSYHDNPPGQT